MAFQASANGPERQVCVGVRPLFQGAFCSFPSPELRSSTPGLRWGRPLLWVPSYAFQAPNRLPEHQVCVGGAPCSGGFLVPPKPKLDDSFVFCALGDPHRQAAQPVASWGGRGARGAGPAPLASSVGTKQRSARASCAFWAPWGPILSAATQSEHLGGPFCSGARPRPAIAQPSRISGLQCALWAPEAQV